jgi:hypothetical protein
MLKPLKGYLCSGFLNSLANATQVTKLRTIKNTGKSKRNAAIGNQSNRSSGI